MAAMAAMARRVRWRRGPGRPGGWRPSRVFVVVAAVLVGVMAVGVSAVLIGQRGATAGSDEGSSAVGTAASPVAPPYPMEAAPDAASGRATTSDSAAAAPNTAGGAAGSASTGPDRSLPVDGGRDLV